MREVRPAPAAEPAGERYAKEGVPISLSTLADQVGGCTVGLTPLFRRLEAHVLIAERLHGDDTTVPILAKGKTDTGRICVYVRDDKPFGEQAPPGAVFYYSRDRAGEHPQVHLAGYSGIFQTDAYGSYGKLYEPSRNAGPILEAACWVHAHDRSLDLEQGPRGDSTGAQRREVLDQKEIQRGRCAQARGQPDTDPH